MSALKTGLATTKPDASAPDGSRLEEAPDASANCVAEVDEVNQVLPCVHCGEPTPCSSDQDPDAVFCCNGCLGAFQLIHGLGLEDFYALRSQSGASSGSTPRVNQNHYARFDSEAYLGESKPSTMDDGNWEVKLAVQGLHCAACTWLIENALGAKPGVLDSRVRLNDHSIRVNFDPQVAPLSEIARTLGRLGYELSPWQDQDDPAQRESHQLLIRIAIAGFFAANAMWIAIALYAGATSNQAYFLRTVGSALGIVAVLWPGSVFLQGAWAALTTRTPHMDLPVGLGLVVGTSVGTYNAVVGSGHVYFDSMATLVFLLLIGRWLKFRQQQRAAKSVDLMLRLMPQHAHRVLEDGLTEDVNLQSLEPGDMVEVRTGESLPVDGLLRSVEGQLENKAFLNCSLLTGESDPVAISTEEQPDTPVFAGTVNTGSTIRVSVLNTGEKTRMGSVMQQVEDATQERVPIVMLADRIGGIFVIAVSLLAMATFAFWFYQDSLAMATSSATALLIVACPCALALATPLAIATGIGRAAKRGILVRDGSVFQRISRPGTVWLDKTGTLTSGRQRVTQVIGDASALPLAAALEAKCNHPVALAVCEAAESHPLRSDLQVEILANASNGRSGIVNGQQVAVGNLRFLESHDFRLTEDQLASLEQIIASGQSPCLIGLNGKASTLLGISDPVLPGLADRIANLRESGWEVGVLSGDHSTIVARVATQLGVAETRCFGSLTPEDKLEKIRESRGLGKPVVMVGDGANDAAALAAADVGIAVRGGAEVSLQAAPVLLTTGVQRLSELFSASRKTQFIIMMTFGISLLYNVIAVTLAMLGMVGPLVAAVFMPISSLSVLAIIAGSRSFPKESP